MNRKNKKGRWVCYPAASTYTFFVLRVAPVEALAESLIREFHRKCWIAGMPITRGRAGMREALVEAAKQARAWVFFNIRV